MFRKLTEEQLDERDKNLMLAYLRLVSKRQEEEKCPTPTIS